MAKYFTIIIFSLVSMVKSQTPDIAYYLKINQPSNHLLDIEIVFDNFSDSLLEMNLPVWRPGRYLIFDFAGSVQSFSAISFSGENLEWEKVSKSTWVIRTLHHKKFIIKYKVYANEFNLRTKGLNDKHAFINGAAVFMYSEKYRDYPLTLKIEPYSDWHVTTGLNKLSDNSDIFSAPNYDYLADCPLEIGNQKDYYFAIGGKSFTISFFGDAEYDIERMKKDFSMIIEKEISFWGKLPFERYIFFIHCFPGNGGGTEHINSTIVGANPKTFESESSYKNFLRLISHEFFHTWNVKQLRPKGIARYNYLKENYTSELWISEGGTSYYDGLILTRTKQMSVDDFFKEIASHIQEERRRPGNNIQSISESGFDAWIKFWKNQPNRYNAESDYYGKGADVSLILDLEIRHSSKNKYSLDDVYRTLYEMFPLGSSGFTNEDFQRVSSQKATVSLSAFFNDYVYGTKQLEWEKYLSYAGLELVSDDSTAAPVIGLKTSSRDGKIIIEDVIAGSSADSAGVMPGDEIVSLDSVRMNYNEMEKRIKEMKTGDTLSLFVFRGNDLKRFVLTMKDTRIPNYIIEKMKQTDELQRRIYENWLECDWE